MFASSDARRPLHSVHCSLQVAGVRSVYKKEGQEEHLFVQSNTHRDIQTAKEIAEHVLFDLLAAKCEIKEADVLGWYQLKCC